MHPASLLHEAGEGMKSWKDFHLIKHDVNRAVQQSLFPEIRQTPRTLEIARNSTDVIRFLDSYNKPGAATVVDIESSKCVPTCVGIAFNNWHALSIPTLRKEVPDHDLVYIWQLLAEFLADNKVKLIAQNGKYDTKRCWEAGLNTRTRAQRS